MKNALERLFELTGQIAKEGVSLVPRVVPADAPFVQYQHYPKGDCIAPGNKSRWFYHAHKPEEREEGEHGHFHMFLPLAMFDGVEPYYQPPAKLPNGKKTQGVVHFGALSFGLDGMPISWFTTNYWVTYEYMMPAEAIASQLRNFDMTGAPGDPLSRIAFEKSGIAKNGSSLVTLSYTDGPTLEIERAAAKHGAPLAMRGREWSATVSETALHYTDRHGELALPLPIMLGVHQAENAALAAAMLRHQDIVTVSPDAIAKGIRSAHWPARLQRFSNGKLGEIDFGFDFWLDGGHNLQAARAVRLTIESDPDVIRQLPKGFGVNVILGMLANKDAEGFIAEIAPIARQFVAVPVPGHDHHSTVSLERMARSAGIETVHSADDVLGALNLLNTGRPGDAWKPTAIIGSLYLAGEVLRLNGTLPD